MLCRYYNVLYNTSRRNIIIKINTKPILTHTNVNQYMFKVYPSPSTSVYTAKRKTLSLWLYCYYCFLVYFLFIEFYPFNCQSLFLVESMVVVAAVTQSSRFMLSLSTFSFYLVHLSTSLSHTVDRIILFFLILLFPLSSWWLFATEFPPPRG